MPVTDMAANFKVFF